MKRLIMALLISALFSACAKKVQAPVQKTAYRVTTSGNWEFIAKVPSDRGEKNLDDLRRVAACVDSGHLIIEVIRLQSIPQKPQK